MNYEYDMVAYIVHEEVWFLKVRDGRTEVFVSEGKVFTSTTKVDRYTRVYLRASEELKMWWI